MSENSNPFQQQAQPQPQKSLKIPTESIPLPSKGLIYPIGTSLCNAESLDIRCMTAREEDLLTSRALLKSGKLIDQLVSACLMDKTIDVGEMISGDRNALLIAIRITGYGAEYGVQIECPECAQSCEHEFTLNGLPIKSLGANPVQPNLNLFDYTLPSGDTVQFKLLTANDERALLKEAERRKKTRIGEKTVTSRLLQEIVSINGEIDKRKISEYIDFMPARDSRELRKYIDKIEPGIEMKQWFTCPECLSESEVNIPLGVTFLWPNFG